ncbi:branched-chain amino acid transporter [Pontibacillus chungwhensis BH030062]|uniref:Branched-chain amino acid transporter n=1 Tax=Pontibacillus chungwhensis BH030062 TaxID=1385513 RepID=A0A0A2UTC5_9BACI|nr:AzlD domain-containing protein [Pontibacillus chungwhensis]KGP90003.1 branched-chain amino acid transporter [Pontibacillus chungwhensis BH030062]
MILVIIGMAIVTMVPRFLPAFVVDRWTFPLWVSRWLNAIPYAALGALIFPGITTVIDGEPHIGLLAGGVAVVFAFLRAHTIVTVLVAIGTVYILTII